ncbi:hypothetical protein [Pandoraea sp. NPDC087047]|uniref:hypothetical protein n=1 Tax=Pandoraea sp. NPDC087047 TaxID=3364390 RepID=UPI003815E33E
MRRMDSSGNLLATARAANLPMVAVSTPAGPSAPPLDYDDFRADFKGSQPGNPGPASHLMQDTRRARADTATQTDSQWEAPPPYEAHETAPRPSAPSPSPVDLPPAYRRASGEWDLHTGNSRSEG